MLATCPKSWQSKQKAKVKWKEKALSNLFGDQSSNYYQSLASWGSLGRRISFLIIPSLHYIQFQAICYQTFFKKKQPLSVTHFYWYWLFSHRSVNILFNVIEARFSSVITKNGYNSFCFSCDYEQNELNNLILF